MCGRFTLRTPMNVLAEQFAILGMPSTMGPMVSRFNIAPTQPVAIVRLASEPERPRRELAMVRWGLIPGWAKDPSTSGRMINARAETVAEKPSFRAAFRRRRCLVLADGFYEWRRTGRAKQPYFIHLADHRPFAMAGLWESWEGADHSIESCTILTTRPNDLLRPIHDRMPVILSPESYDLWLDASAAVGPPLFDALRPYPAEAMAAYPVSTHVNSPSHEDPRCVEPVGVAGA